MHEKCARHWPTTQNIRKCLLSIHIQIWVLLTLIQYFIAELSSCQVFRCSPSHHVDQETCTERRKRSISSPRLGASKPPHFHKTEESHVLIAWPPNSRLRTSPTHLPSLMVALSLDYHVIWLGEASWWSNALHTRSIHLKHWIFCRRRRQDLDSFTNSSLCMQVLNNNFLSPIFLFMRKQLYMWLRMVFSRYENHWNTFL